MSIILDCGLHHWPRRTAATIGLLLALGVLAVPAAAQSGTRYTWGATLTGSAVYDDNVFFESARPQDGTVMRFRPGANGSYRLTRDLSLDASYSIDADYYPAQPELTELFASQAASLGGQYQVGARTNLGVGAQYSRSATGADLIGGAGLELGRVPGRAWGYHVGGSRVVTRAGTLGLDYAQQNVTYEGTRESRAHSVAVNWSQQLGSRTGLSLGVGPRFVDGSTSAEVTASLQRRIQHGSLSLGYGRSRYAAPGRDVDAESLSATAQLTLSPAVQVSATPAVFRHRFGDDGDGRSWRVALTASWQIRRELSARASYHHLRQDGRAGQGTPLAREPWVSRNLFSISFSTGVGRSRGARLSPGVGPSRLRPNDEE